MASIDVEKTARSVFGDLHRNWGWLLALGILMVVLGLVGLGMTYWLTVFAVIWFGVLAAIGGIAQLFGAFRHKGWKSTVWQVLIGLVYLGAGVVMIALPLASAVWLTLFIAGALIAIGVMRLIMAFQLKGGAAIWVGLAGAVSILLGFMVFADWPISGAWVIGLFVAIDLIFHGMALVSVALAARSLPTDPPGGATAA